jgi:tellurite resistance protein TerC
MRGVFIGGGQALLHRFHWMMYVFGAFLIYTGGKLLFKAKKRATRKTTRRLKLGAPLHSLRQRLSTATSSG